MREIKIIIRLTYTHSEPRYKGLFMGEGKDLFCPPPDLEKRAKWIKEETKVEKEQNKIGQKCDIFSFYFTF